MLGLFSENNLTVIVKVASTCNLGCIYCYATDRLGKVLPDSYMKRETLRELVRQVVSLDKSFINFIWHGGEPLLVGRGFFEAAITFQNEFKRPHQRIANSIQTNGMLLNSEWANFLKANDFSIGLSVDGPALVHDMQRRTGNNKPSFERVSAGISTLKEHQIGFGALAVVTRHSPNYINEVFDFVKKQAFQSIDFLPYVEFDPISQRITDLSITPIDFAEFMNKLFDIWYELDNPLIKIRYFDNIMVALSGETPPTCTFNGNCSKFLAIAPSGDLYHCDWFIGQKDKCFGNIWENSISSLIRSDKYMDYIAQINSPKVECQTCKWKAVCNGGCSYHRSIQGTFQSPYYFCQSRKQIINHVNSSFQTTLGQLGIVGLPTWEEGKENQLTDAVDIIALENVK